MTGAVRLKLFKGDCRVVGRKSPFALYDQALATYDAGDPFDRSATEGFIKIWGLPIETAARKAAGRRDHGRALTMAHLWSGRFAGDPDAALFAFGASFRFDRRLFEDDVRGQPGVGGGARARRRDLGRRRRGDPRPRSHEILARGCADPGVLRHRRSRAQDEDVHAFVERELSARVGDAGRRLHTGRSRNEQVAVDLRLYLKRRVPELQRRPRERSSRVLADRAAERGRRADAVVHAPAPRAADPGRALSSWRTPPRSGATTRRFDVVLEGGRRTAARLRRDRRHQLPDRRRRWLAATLGFSRVVANSIDATGDRDFVSSFLHACALDDGAPEPRSPRT